MKVTIHVIDEINCQIDGLKPEHLESIIEATKMRVAGCTHTAAYKLDLWDGKESFLTNDGFTFLHFLKRVLPHIVEYGYIVDIDDQRPTSPKKLSPVNSSLLEQYGIILRPYQVETINAVVDNNQGLVDVATSGGKTSICAAITKVYDDFYRCLVIVPNENLVTQTQKTFLSVGLDTGVISGKINAKRKEKEWKKRHIISTWQALIRNKDYLRNFDIILYDEVHILGDSMFNTLQNELSHAHIRVGFSGSIPKDKHKREKIMCYIGGDVLYSVKPKQLQDEGYISTCDITMIPVNHRIVLPDDEWSTEKKYMDNNIPRLKAIASFIREFISASPENTLILTHPQFGSKLAAILGTDFIDDEIDAKVRDKMYRKYNNDDSNYVLTATFGTVGTGISIDTIRRMFLIDVGKNYTRILQGIGRGLRLDGKENHLQVFDLYSKLFRQSNDNTQEITYGYGCYEHYKERKKVYREMKYPFIEIEGIDVDE